MWPLWKTSKNTSKMRSRNSTACRAKVSWDASP
jgi:hypothetical protein